MPHTPMEIIDNWMDPNFKFFINREGSRLDFLMQEERMKGEYLGSCLDYLRWGGLNTVMYNMGTKGLIKFIRHWMKLNQGNLIWSDENPPKDSRLPHIKHDECPRNKTHKKTAKDLGGKLRCIELEKGDGLRPSFIMSDENFDDYSQTPKISYYEDEPINPVPDDAWDSKGLDPWYEKDWEEYQKEMAKFEAEKPTVIPRGLCYAIISDEEIILPLETVLNRLNILPNTKTVYCEGAFSHSPCRRLDELEKENREYAIAMGWCRGHTEKQNQTVHPFCGWTLAWQVQKWYEQVPDGKSPILNRTGKIDNYKAFPNFQIISSED